MRFVGHRAPEARRMDMPPGRLSPRLIALGGEPVRLVARGGAPISRVIVMWWEFVGSAHDDKVDFRNAWQARSDRFGNVAAFEDERPWLPALALAPVGVMPRRQRRRSASSEVRKPR